MSEMCQDRVKVTGDCLYKVVHKVSIAAAKMSKCVTFDFCARFKVFVPSVPLS